MKVLMCGGSGFLGTAIRKKLHSLNVDVALIYRKFSESDCLLFNNEKKILIDWPRDIKELAFNDYDFVFFLSHAPVSESMQFSDVLKINFEPLKLFLDTIENQIASPHLIFVSSQSALSSVRSNYGELKRASEDLLRQAKCPVTVIRPGLIIGAGTSGLFNSIRKIINLSPVIPLVGSPKDVIQPLYIDDFVRILFKVTGIEAGRSRQGYRCIELADRPISFHAFLRQMAEVKGAKNFFIPIPNRLATFGLLILEHMFRFKKITSSSLLGFLQLSTLDSELIWKELNEKPTTIYDSIRLSIKDQDLYDYSNYNNQELLSKEAKFFCLSLFRKEPTSELINAYIKAHEKLPRNLNSERGKILTIIHNKVDPVAIEFATRGKIKSLNLKLSLLCYLAENLPGFSDKFENEIEDKPRAFLVLFKKAMLTPFIYIKGFYLARRYSLV